MAQVVRIPQGHATPAEDILGPIREKVEQGKRDRKKREPVWHQNRAFASGKQWLKWSRGDRSLKLDPRDVAEGKQRYTVDLLSQYMGTGEGLLAGADDRRDLVFSKEDTPSEQFTKAANDALGFGWDVEFGAPAALTRTKRRILVDGTAAVQAVFDPTVGRELGQVPIGDGRSVTVLGANEGEPPQMMPTKAGQPILEGPLARAYIAEHQAEGTQPEYRNMKEGRIRYRAYSVFNIIVPPGIEDEDDFPWEAIVDAVPIDTLITEYGDKAQGLQAEPLAALEMLGVKESFEDSMGSDPEDADTPGKLDGHVARVRFYERPCREYPKGRFVCYAGERLLHQRDELPVRRANGDYSSGIAYFHYRPVEGRFWGRSLVEQGKSPQRAFNRRVQQIAETIDRGQPYMVVSGDEDPIKSSDRPLEIVKVPKFGQIPTAVQGIGPGEWMWRSLEELRQELEEAMGIKGVELGENPSNVNTYGQLQLLAEKARTKTNPIVEDFQAGIERLEEFSVYLMRRFWPADKQIAIIGEEEMAEAVEFKASELPEFFRFKVAEGARTRSQAAEIQLVTDVWNAAQTILATEQDPMVKHRWLQWYVDSLKAGKMLPLPDSPTDSQDEKARWQNAQLSEGEAVQAAEWDVPEIHLPIHEELRVEMEMAGRDDIVQIVSEHIAEDQAIAQQAADAQAQAEQEQAAQQQQAAAEQQAQASADQQNQAQQDFENKAALELLRAQTKPPPIGAR